MLSGAPLCQSVKRLHFPKNSGTCQLSMWQERLKLEQSVSFDVKTNRVEKLSFLAKHKHRRFSPVNTLLAGFRLVEGSQGI